MLPALPGKVFGLFHWRQYPHAIFLIYEGHRVSPTQKAKTSKIPRILIGFCAGFLCWSTGLHCLELDGAGNLSLSGRKFWNHLTRVFFWVFGIAFLYHAFRCYWRWSMTAPRFEVIFSLLLPVALLVGLWFFGRRFLFFVLPGFHEFLCPQCYQRQTFRFLPVSFQFDFFVTYLCPHCTCLVNGWGEQIFYPQNIPFEKLTPEILKLCPCVLLAAVLGLGFNVILWNYLARC